MGLGYSFQDYNSNLVRFNVNNDSSIYIVNYTLNQKSKLSFNFIEFPISLRLRNSSPNNHQFWRVYTGFKFQRNFLSKLKYNSREIRNISDEVNNWNKELYLSIGYNTWLLDIFEPSVGTVPVRFDSHVSTNQLSGDSPTFQYRWQATSWMSSPSY